MLSLSLVRLLSNFRKMQDLKCSENDLNLINKVDFLDLKDLRETKRVFVKI